MVVDRVVGDVLMVLANVILRLGSLDADCGGVGAEAFAFFATYA